MPHATSLAFGAPPTALFTPSGDIAAPETARIPPRPTEPRGLPRALPRGVSVIPPQPEPKSPRARLLGETRSGLLLAEDDLGLVLIDRQATRELTTLRTLRARAPAQPLLIPARLDLAPHEAAALTTRLDDLRTLGVWVEPFGGPTFQLLGVPPATLGASPVRLLEAVASACAARVEPDAEALMRAIAAVSATSRDGSAEPADRTVSDALALAESDLRDHRGRRPFVRMSLAELARRFET